MQENISYNLQIQLNPYKYLKYILTQIPIYIFEKKSLDDLLPWNVKLD